MKYLSEYFNSKKLIYFFKKRGKYKKSGYKFAPSTLAFLTHKAFLGQPPTFCNSLSFTIKPASKQREKMKLSPAAFVLFFSLASIGTSNPMTPKQSEALYTVNHAQNLVNQTPLPLSFPSFLLVPLSVIHLQAAFLTPNGKNSQQGPIVCNIARYGYENFALPWRIKQAEDYLHKKGGDFVAKGLQTEIAFCWYNAAISIVNYVRFSSLSVFFFLSAPLAPPLTHHHHHHHENTYLKVDIN